MFRSASLFIGTSFTVAVFTIFATSNVDSIVGIPHKIYSMQKNLIHIKANLFVKCAHLHPGYAANLVARSRYYHCHWTVFPAQRASNAENVSIWWRHCELNETRKPVCPRASPCAIYGEFLEKMAENKFMRIDDMLFGFVPKRGTMYRRHIHCTPARRTDPCR